MHIPSWDSIEDYVRRGVPAQLPVLGGAESCFVVHPTGSNLTLRLYCTAAEELPPSPYVELDISARQVGGRDVIELSVADRDLFRHFYFFSTEVLEELGKRGQTPAAAVAIAIETWSKLLSRRQVLSSSEQLGLRGELMFLAALLRAGLHAAVASWTGPAGEPHDFRLGTREIEVKSTLQTKRRHVVHGLQQLEPSPGMELFVLSLMFEPAGLSRAGKTLSDCVVDVRLLLAGRERERAEFDAYLESRRYHDGDAAQYPSCLQLRAAPMLIPADTSVPRITRKLMSTVFPPAVTQRLIDIDYEVDLDGLGFEEGSAEYEAALGRVRITRK